MASTWLAVILAEGLTCRPGPLKFHQVPGPQPYLPPLVQAAVKPHEAHMQAVGPPTSITQTHHGA